MTWTIEFTSEFNKALIRLEKWTQKRVLPFFNDRLLAKDEPRSLGKQLTDPLRK